MHDNITGTTLLGILNRTVTAECVFAESAPAPLSPPPALLSPALAQPSPTPAHATCASSSDNYEDDDGGKDKDDINGRSSTRHRLSSSATTAFVVRASEGSNFVADFNSLFPSKKLDYKNRRNDRLKELGKMLQSLTVSATFLTYHFKSVSKITVVQ
ncbi:hypothetical protein HMPREF1544_02062 [Mucor circinelloides 1006PhL]|uniref:Uncharacterized protein n=1 Tax=Mucor circinelloides f. circinelloides (strain 1006PhL) TaxID=1220926 RepID=S2K6H7_MUCC1|nr:hypothetical protein HMPREF1544_02062 [Mucor circinelloides 1006PhL]